MRLDARMSHTVLESLNPDNVNIPPDLKVSMYQRDGEAGFEISGSIPQVIGTADEMLAHAQVALDVVEQ